MMKYVEGGSLYEMIHERKVKFGVHKELKMNVMLQGWPTCMGRSGCIWTSS